jgi:hypothetical protein
MNPGRPPLLLPHGPHVALKIVVEAFEPVSESHSLRPVLTASTDAQPSRSRSVHAF